MKRIALFATALIALAGLAAPAFAGAPGSRAQLTRQAAASEFASFAKVKKTRGAGNTVGQWAKTQTSATAGTALVGIQLTAEQTSMNAATLVSGLESVR